MIYSFDFPTDYKDNLIGIYDKSSGDSPHNLKAFGYKSDWKAPIVNFDIAERKIDPIPSTNLPVQIMRNDLANEIKNIAGEELLIIPITVFFKKKKSGNYSIILPVREVAIWDLAESQWEPLNTPDWPKHKPMFLYDMVLLKSLPTDFHIAYNNAFNGMIVFTESVKKKIEQYSSWVSIFTPQHYRNQ